MKNFRLVTCIALLIGLLIGFTTNLNAQTKQDKPPVGQIIGQAKSILPDSAKLTIKSVYEDTKSALSSLGAALKVGAEHVYEVLVRQQVVVSITNLVVMVIAIILILVFCRGAKNGEVWFVNRDNDPTAIFFVRLFSGIVGTVTFVIYLCFIGETIAGFVNPEYGALKEIMNLIKH